MKRFIKIGGVVYNTDVIETVSDRLVTFNGATIPTNQTRLGITPTEAEQIQKALLSEETPLSKEVSALTHVIRDLWNLLRARMR